MPPRFAGPRCLLLDLPDEVLQHLWMQHLLACDLTGAKLDHANLKMAQFDMGGANNAPCTLDGVSAFGANFEEVEIQGDPMNMVSAKNADFINTNWWKSKTEFIDLTGSTFSYSSLSETEVTSVNYDGVDFTSSTFFKANFEMCSAREATFYGSNMNHVQASQSDFASADFRMVDASFATFDIDVVLDCGDWMGATGSQYFNMPNAQHLRMYLKRPKAREYFYCT